MIINLCPVNKFLIKLLNCYDLFILNEFKIYLIMFCNMKKVINNNLII